MRAVELASIAAFLALAAAQLARLEPGWVLAAAALAGWLAADLLSGMVHWALDSFGSVRTPLVGPALIRPFREHHADAARRGRHGHAVARLRPRPSWRSPRAADRRRLVANGTPGEAPGRRTVYGHRESPRDDVVSPRFPVRDGRRRHPQNTLTDP